MFSCPCTLIAFAASSTELQLEFKGCEVSDNDIHPIKSICGRLADKESVLQSSNCTEHP